MRRIERGIGGLLAARDPALAARMCLSQRLYRAGINFPQSKQGFFGPDKVMAHKSHIRPLFETTVKQPNLQRRGWSGNYTPSRRLDRPRSQAPSVARKLEQAGIESQLESWFNPVPS